VFLNGRMSWVISALERNPEGAIGEDRSGVGWGQAMRGMQGAYEDHF